MYLCKQNICSIMRLVRKHHFSASRPKFPKSTRRGHRAMFLTLLRERNTAFAPAFPFTLHPVGKRRSFLPTEGRIISRFSPLSSTILPSNAVCWLCSVFNAVLSPQSSVLEVKRNPVAWRGKKIASKTRFSGREASAPLDSRERLHRIQPRPHRSQNQQIPAEPAAGQELCAREFRRLQARS